MRLAGRFAAGDRASRRTNQDAVGRGDHPASRRPVPGACRPDQPQAGTPPVAVVDHLLELRPAVPRRPARSLGAGHVRGRCAPAGGGVRPRSARCARSRGDRRGRPAREPVAGDRRRPRDVTVGAAPDPDGAHPLRYRLLDSIRAFALEAMAYAGVAEPPGPHTPPGSPRPPGPRPRACAAAARPSTSRSPAPNAPTSTRHWPGVPRTTRVQALRLVNGFGWAWVVLGDSRGAQRILAALEASGDGGHGPGPRQRAPARGLDRGVVGPPRSRPPPHRRSDRAGRGDPRRGPERLAAATTWLTSSPTTASFALRSSSPSAAGPSTTRWTGRGTRPRTHCSPPERRSRPVTRQRAVDAARPGATLAG